MGAGEKNCLTVENAEIEGGRERCNGIVIVWGS